ncbi:MAG: hypothetical protein R3E87_04230 [Burkholderiaceae bacterium]
MNDRHHRPLSAAGRGRPASLALAACGVLFSALPPAQAADTVTRGPIVTKSAPDTKQAGTVGTAGSLYWYDGERRRPLVQRPNQTLSDKGLNDSTSHPIAKQSPPVFVDANSPSVVRALPGGVIVRVTEPTDADGLRELLSGFDIEIERRIGDTGLIWLLTGDPGVASIQLANAIYESGLVKSASPNWLNVRARK